MTYEAHVRGGAIILDEPIPLTEGMKITVSIPQFPPTNSDDSSVKRTSLLEHLGDVVGSIEGPTDLAENHDHYLHGRPKK